MPGQHDSWVAPRLQARQTRAPSAGTGRMLGQTVSALGGQGNSGEEQGRPHTGSGLHVGLPLQAPAAVAPSSSLLCSIHYILCLFKDCCVLTFYITAFLQEHSFWIFLINNYLVSSSEKQVTVLSPLMITVNIFPHL